MREIHYEIAMGPDRRVRGTVELPPETTWPAPVVLFCHGFKGFKDWGPWPWLTSRLAAQGFVVNRLNFSLCGVGVAGDRHDEPEKFARNTYGHELEDLGRVVDERSGWGVPDAAMGEPLGIVGHSRGGLVSLLFAARRPEVGAVVSLASPGSADRFDADVKEEWRSQGHLDVLNARTGEVLKLDVSVLDDFEAREEEYDLARAVSARDVPTLIVHGDRDETVPVAEARWIESAMRHPRSRVVTIPGAGHTFECSHPFADPNPEIRTVLEETTTWLKEHLVR